MQEDGLLNGSYEEVEVQGFHDSESRNKLPDLEALPKFRPTSWESACYMRVSRRTDVRALQCEQQYRASMKRDAVGICGKPELRVCTMYKRKADKVRPVDSSESDGTVPGGFSD